MLRSQLLVRAPLQCDPDSCRDCKRGRAETGMDRDELLEGLSQHLPEFVDQLTPQGRLPTEEEASRMV